MKNPVLSLIIIVTAACIIAALFCRLGPLRLLELNVLDYHFRLRGHQEVDERLSLILIDQHTVKKYGFPFSRGHYAIVANALANAGAKVVAFDYIFDQERPYDKVGDQMLVEVTSSNENTIHAWSAGLSGKAFTKLTSPKNSHSFSS